MDKKIVGIIGAGAIGTAFAKLAISAGMRVLISNSRGPETLADLAEELGPLAQAKTVSETAAQADFVVISIPFHQIDTLPAQELRGKIIIDPSNYAAVRDGHIEEIEKGTYTGSAYIQKNLPESRVIKAFGSLNAGQYVPLARPAGAADRSAIPVAGDDVEALAQVLTLVDKLGYDTVLVGTLAESWRFGPFMPAFAIPYLSDLKALVDFHINRTDSSGQPPADSGKPVSKAQLRELLSQARRDITMEEFFDDLKRSVGYV